MAFNPMEHMMDLKGKQYLQVMWRLVWFREEHPDWSIQTEMVDHDKDNHSAMFIAIIHDNEGKPVQTGYGSESIKDFKDYIEKAETKAVGRALAMLGYGTQFAPELDEGERIVDSPVQQKQKAPSKSNNLPKTGRIEIENPTADDIKNIAEAVKEELMVTQQQIGQISKLLNEKGIFPKQVMDRYKVSNIHELTAKQADDCIKGLIRTRGTKDV